jgi:hypothetical protein
MSKKLLVAILMAIAAVILILSITSIASSYNIKKLGVTAESTITDVVRRSSKGGNYKYVTVSFTTPDGKQVTTKATTRKIISRGEKLTVWYDPAAPERIDFGDTIRYNFRGVAIGILLFLFGLYYFIRYSKEDNLKKRLLLKGTKISAEFVSVLRNEKYRMGEKNPWFIKCRWVDNSNNKEYFFVSKDYTIDPSPYLNGRYHIDVFIYATDPTKYYLDASFMPSGYNTLN